MVIKDGEHLCSIMVLAGWGGGLLRDVHGIVTFGIQKMNSSLAQWPTISHFI